MYHSKEHFRATYENLNPRFNFRGVSIEDLREWQVEFRPKVEKAIGLKNLENDRPWTFGPCSVRSKCPWTTRKFPKPLED